VLVAALALLAAPPPAYLIGDGPTRQQVIALVSACGLDRLVRLPGWSAPLATSARACTPPALDLADAEEPRGPRVGELRLPLDGSGVRASQSRASPGADHQIR
jgi:hypothetical protein